ncbi:MAG: glycosyltransferase [Chloroflexi bacterium]|nr:glycosyltransferase [Chloroflexota bacterium]
MTHTARSLRILFLTPQLPYPPHQGTSMRNFYLMAHLARRHQVSLCSFLDAPLAQTDLGPLAALCQGIEGEPTPTRTLTERLRTTFTSSWPDMGLRLASPAFHSRLAAWLAREPFDVVEVEGIEMARYGQQALAARQGPHPAVVFDDHNAEYILQQRAYETDRRHPRRWPGALYSFIQWQKLRRYEAGFCCAADRVAAVSEADAQALARLVPGLAPRVVPNGVDVASYRGFTSPADFPPLQRPALVFTGKMDFRPNVDGVLWFWQEVWPSIRQAQPTAHFYVVGQRPHTRLAPLAADPTVTVTGLVPDVRPYIAEADAYVIPLRMGGGTRLKVLEAMAMGKGLVSTALGCEGFPLAPGQHLLVADSPGDFAAATLALLAEPSRREALGQAAQTFAAAHYDWEAIVPSLEALLLEAVAEREARG